MRRARTVDHDGRVRERVTLPSFACSEEEGAHGARLPDAVRVYRGGDVLTPHGLVCRTYEFAKVQDITCIYICMNQQEDHMEGGSGAYCVIDGEARSDAAARRVDVEVDGLGRLFCLEEEQLCYGQRRVGVSDLWGSSK